jgi:hypothetical protein
MNITSIIKKFQSSANFSTDNEVELFRHFAQSVCLHSNSSFIDETHGMVAQVEFVSGFKGLNRCEISDLLIITKNGRHPEYRATFWQAKKESKPKWPSPRGDNNFDFKGQFNQWELLSCRPSIRGLGKFSPPSYLLSDAESPSIGSFGVFHEDNGLVEVNYSVAEMVVTSSIGAYPKMVINEKLSQYSAWDNEVLVMPNIETFLKAINAFSVGSLISPATDIGRWMLKYISNKCVVNGIHDFINIDQIDPDQNPENFNGDGISMLLINIENDEINHSQT